MTSNRQRKRILKSVRKARTPQAPSDVFGLGKEVRIVESGIRSVFTPHQPISESDFLFGRGSEVGAFITALNTPGRHALLYGDRGVGKTSLANVVQVLHRLATNTPTIVKRCDRRDSFESIVRGALTMVNENPNLKSVQIGSETIKSRGGEVGGMSMGSSASSSAASTYEYSAYFTPSVVAEALSTTRAVLLIDETDALVNPVDREQLAELIKLLSDSHSPLKVMIVGIAQTAGELTAAHPSVRRCLSEKRLGRMSESELREILTVGGSVTGMTFAEEVKSAIVHMSLGYPHFTHLLGLKSAEFAIGHGSKRIVMSDLENAVVSAVNDSEGSLTQVYEDSIRSASTDMFKRVVVAAAKIGAVEFSAPELRAQLSSDTGRTITQNALNNYFQRLVSTDGSTILRRTAHGHYRFEDPRMASFVRMVNVITGA